MFESSYPDNSISKWKSVCVHFLRWLSRPHLNCRLPFSNPEKKLNFANVTRWGWFLGLSNERQQNKTLGTKQYSKLDSILKFNVEDSSRSKNTFILIIKCSGIIFQKREYQGVATSRLVYTPAIEDDGRYLTCRVLAGGRIKESLEDTWEIKVLCE